MADEINLAPEQWRLSPIFGEVYEVSDLGRVRRGTRIKTLTVDNLGYSQAHLSYKGVPSCARVHRLVAIAFLGSPSVERYQVNHKNGRKTDNRVCNLEWVSHSENMKHAHRIGLISTAGENSRSGRLSWNEVREIRRRAGGGEKHRFLAYDFGVCRAHVSAIVSGRFWKELPAPSALELTNEVL